MNNLNLLRKIIFFWKKPKIIIVTGNGQKATAEAIFCLLSQNFKVAKFKEKAPDILSIYKKEILIFETDLIEPQAVKNLQFLVKKSQLPILVITQIGDIPPAAPSGEPRPQSGRDKDFFAGDKKDIIQSRGVVKQKLYYPPRKLAKILPAHGYLILNFDDETVREIRDSNPATAPSHILTFGFQDSNPPTTLPPFGRAPGADFRATDIKLNTQALAKGGEETLVSSTTGTNFKINYKGNIVPIWLEKLFSKEQIYSALAAAAVGTVLGFNLVEISSSLKNYNPL